MWSFQAFMSQNFLAKLTLMGRLVCSWRKGPELEANELNDFALFLPLQVESVTDTFTYFKGKDF